jgi:hypothetical protein
MNPYNPTCHNCNKPLKNLGLTANGFLKFKTCNCLKNKKKMGNGTYVYICGKPLQTGLLCKNVDKRNGCSIHTFWKKENK